MEPSSWDVERREDGAILVRVHSCSPQGRRLPDAVFTFRPCDPQFTDWKQKLNDRAAEVLPLGVASSGFGHHSLKDL